MNAPRLAWLSLLLCAAGCQYEHPLVEDQGIPINPELLGFWEAVEPQDAEPGPFEQFLVLPFSATEYMIQFPMANERTQGIFYRAYHFDEAGISGVQLQVIGTGPGHFRIADDRLYQVVRFSLEEDRLTLAVLNEDRIPHALASSEDLLQAFQQYAGDAGLFGDEAVFRRVRPGP